MLDILIIEDNNHKRGKVIAFIEEILPNCVITEAHSFTAGCKEIFSEKFDIILMDMSLPTYDKSATESGGRFRTFGGREIARKIVKREIDTKIIFITQYESFGDRGKTFSLDSLNSDLITECKNCFLGLIHYDSSKSRWKDQLRTALLEEKQ